MAAFQIKRIYDEPSGEDGYRILVDRLWPRGVKKEQAKLDEWNKEIAPSAGLRKWFGHKPERFEEFASRYSKELDKQKDELKRLEALGERSMVSLLYGARDPEVNHATVLLQKLMRKQR